MEESTPITESAINAPASATAPDTDFAAPPRKRVLWKWSLGATVLVLSFLMWQCGSALYEGRNLAIAAVWEFHLRMNEGSFQKLCQDADESFTHPGDQDTIKFLQAVHTKLGNAGASNLQNIRVNATPNGTFVVTQHTTAYDRGSAQETFTWKKSNGALRLYAYHIESNALILN
jgi:hypothetical protein